MPGLSFECHRDFIYYLDALEKFELWALKSIGKLPEFSYNLLTEILYSVYDANGQLSVGILSGNVNQYGDFEECLSTEDVNLHFRGKHCFSEIQPFVTESATYLNFLRRLIQSYDLMQSRFEDVSV